MTIVLIDTSALAYRSFYTTGRLTYGSQNTGVLYGIFRYMEQLHKLHSDGQLVWCFDRPSTNRKEVFPEYKIKRTMTDLEDAAVVAAKKVLYDQINELGCRYLPCMGYNNVFSRDGYEADDVIAAIVHGIRGKKVIVSSDNDLLQLLDADCVIEPPNGATINAQTFKAKWGIDPGLWASVKAIAGCTTDGVPGVQGVGEKTAVKYLLGQLSRTSNVYQRILDSAELIERNRQLVTLPFPGVGKFKLHDDALSDSKKSKVYRGLGMLSLLK